MAELTDEDIAKFDAHGNQDKPSKALTDADIASFDSSSKQAPSVQSEGVGYLAQHPFKTQFQPLAKTLTGKSLEDMAQEHVMSEPFTRPPADAPFDRNLKSINPKASLELGYAQNADLLSAPINMFGGAVAKVAGEGIGLGAKAIGAIPEMAGNASERIHNLMVKLPTKAYRYSKDPLAVLKDEKITANTMDDYAKQASERLQQRTDELNSAIADSDKAVNISEIMDGHIKEATSSAKGSLQDRAAVLDKLKYLKKALTKQYGDLANLPVQKAVKLYRQLADDFPFSGDAEGNIMAKTAHKMYHDIGAVVDEAHPEIKELNHRVSGLIDISKAAQNRAAIESRNNPIGLIGNLLGIGASGMIGGMHGAEAGLGLAIGLKALSSPAMLTRVANALSMMSDIEKASVLKSFPFIKTKLPNLFNGLKNSKSEFTANPFDDLTSMGSFKSTSPTEEGFNPTGGVNKDPLLDELWQRKAQGEGFEGTKPTPEVKQKAQDQINDIWAKGIGIKIPDSSKKAAIIGGATGLGAVATQDNANAMAQIPKEGAVLNGQASTYGWGEKLNANRFDNKPFNAKETFVAMRNVPMGTKVRVTDTKTGKSIETTVQDGGPAQKTKRVVDLSQGAWRSLGYKRAGLTDVKVEIIKLGSGRSYPRHK